MSRVFLFAKNIKKLLIKIEICVIIILSCYRSDFLNVFDFDNTIYKGESSFNYYFFCVKHHPTLIRFVFTVLFCLIKYKLCIISVDGFMQLCRKYVYDFVKGCPDAEELAEKFWEKNFKKIKSFYFDMKNEDDVIISASFGFIIRPAMRKLGIKNLVCSEIDLEAKEIKHLCFRKNKKHLFEEMFDGAKIENFYTDSLNDIALLREAENGYIVKGNKIKKWSEE